MGEERLPKKMEKIQEDGRPQGWPRGSRSQRGKKRAASQGGKELGGSDKMEKSSSKLEWDPDM